VEAKEVEAMEVKLVGVEAATEAGLCPSSRVVQFLQIVTFIFNNSMALFQFTMSFLCRKNCKKPSGCCK
jgi:hypothetical protein